MRSSDWSSDVCSSDLLVSVLGLALGFVLKLMMGSSLGESGGYVFGALALTVVFCHILGWLSLIVNFSCMTFLATITIPHVQMHGDFRNMLIALLIGIVYFGVDRKSPRLKYSH